MSYFKQDWIPKYLKKEPSVILDIGSGNGAESLGFKNRYKNSKVVCFEADPSLYEKIKQTVNTRKFDIDVQNLAICDFDGEIEFYSVINHTKGAGSIHRPTKKMARHHPEIKFNESTKVQCSRIDTFCKKNLINEIDLIHMDIQSAEYRALIGVGDMRPKMIFLEVSLEFKGYYENSEKRTSEKLTEMGYLLTEKIKGDELWILKN